MKMNLHREKRCLHEVRLGDGRIPGFNGICPALLDSKNESIGMGTCRVRLNANKMIGMSMRQEDNERSGVPGLTHADNPEQVCCLFGQSTGIYQDNDIRGCDKVGIGRYGIDLPDQGIERCSRCTRDRFPLNRVRLAITRWQALLPLTDR